MIRKIKRIFRGLALAISASCGKLADYDDRELGFMVKTTAELMLSVGLTKPLTKTLHCSSAMMVAISEARASNADSFAFSVYGLTSAGKEVGDWELVVRQISRAERAARDAARNDKAPGEVILSLIDPDPQQRIDEFEQISQLTISVDVQDGSIRSIDLRGTPKAA
jgi:hypothetical protein